MAMMVPEYVVAKISETLNGDKNNRTTIHGFSLIKVSDATKLLKPHPNTGAYYREINDGGYLLIIPPTLFTRPKTRREIAEGWEQRPSFFPGRAFVINSHHGFNTIRNEGDDFVFDNKVLVITKRPFTETYRGSLYHSGRESFCTGNYFQTVFPLKDINVNAFITATVEFAFSVNKNDGALWEEDKCFDHGMIICEPEDYLNPKWKELETKLRDDLHDELKSLELI
jgi:hypothetical protein